MSGSLYSNNPGSSVIILEKNLVEIGLKASEILLFVKYDPEVYFQGQLMWYVCCQPQSSFW